MVLFPPYALLLLNLLSGGSDQISLVYDGVAKNVGIVSGPLLWISHLTDNARFHSIWVSPWRLEWSPESSLNEASQHTNSISSSSISVLYLC